MELQPGYLELLNQIEGIHVAFVSRVPGVEVSTDREATVKALEPAHQKVVKDLGYDWTKLWRAEQVHGNGIAKISDRDIADTSTAIPAVDGLMTKAKGIVLGIYVADCGAVLIADKRQKYIAALHSGKKGTELNITGKAIAEMKSTWNSNPEDLVVVLAPCIRPPHYEVNFSAEIKEQVLAEGVPSQNYHDCGICTAASVETYYSYRLEKGNTGRMLAIIGN